MSGDGFHGSRLGIAPERMGAPFSFEIATVAPQVSEQRGALHLRETVVRSAS
jgi:hypothetical protein